MKKFHSIESFTHLVRKSRAHAAYIGVPVETLAPLKFKGTVKLHGTNGGVRITPANEVFAQSKTAQLSIQSDNARFCAFVEGVPSGVWIGLADELCALHNRERSEDVTIFGEWVGTGIQKGAAVCGCPKHFVIFRAAIGDVMVDKVEQIGLALQEHSIYNINQVPALNLTVDFSNLQAASDYLNKVTEECEAECPWAKNMFGISGIGEGYVWEVVGRPDETGLNFKTKGDKHKVRSSPTNNVAPVDPELVNSIKDCVAIVLTDNRMEQMVNDNKLEFIPENIGAFLKAVSQDIIKEESLILEANNLTWKDIGKLTMSLARQWFTDRITL